MTKQEFRKQLKEVAEEYIEYDKGNDALKSFVKWVESEMPIEEEKVEKWSADKLKKGDEYWYIESYGEIEYSMWESDVVDNFRLKSGNIYQTEEIAQEAYNKIINK